MTRATVRREVSGGLAGCQVAVRGILVVAISTLILSACGNNTDAELQGASNPSDSKNAPADSSPRESSGAPGPDQGEAADSFQLDQARASTIFEGRSGKCLGLDESVLASLVGAAPVGIVENSNPCELVYEFGNTGYVQVGVDPDITDRESAERNYGSCSDLGDLALEVFICNPAGEGTEYAVFAYYPTSAGLVIITTNETTAADLARHLSEYGSK